MNFVRFFRKYSPFFAPAVFIIVFFTACASLSPLYKAKDTLSVHFIDVGLGDSIFIDMPSGKNMLVDAGDKAAGPRVAAYLKSIGVKNIDHLILTHQDDDHIGGMFDILSEFEVGHYYDNGLGNLRSTFYGDYIFSVRNDLSRYTILQKGESLSFGDVHFEVLNPFLPPTGNQNNDSIVFRLIYGDTRMLFTADMGQNVEKMLLAHGTDLSSQILKVGHHGENDASSKDFLHSVGPEVAIISVSTINIYGRPHRDVLGRIEETGAQLYRTDQHGNVVLRTDGATYSITTDHE